MPWLAYDIIMIICMALGANWQKYQGVTQLHPLDDKVLGVPLFLANRYARGSVNVCTYVQTEYDKKKHEKRSVPISPPNSGQDIFHGSGQ